MANGNGSAISTALVYAPIERVNYFYGQLLTERDLRAEQDYNTSIRRLMQRELFGSGTVAGLRVEAIGTPPSVAIRVHPGLAIDPDGRELVLGASVDVDAAPDALTAGSATYFGSGDDASDLAADLGDASAWNASIDANDVNTLWRLLYQAGMASDIDASTTVPPADPTPPTDLPMLKNLLKKIGDPPSGFSLPPGVVLLEYLFRRLIGASFVQLRYCERGTVPTPGVLGTCCDPDACHPGRLQEGVEILVNEVWPDNYDEELAARVIFETCLENDQNPFGATTSSGPPFEHDCAACLAETVMGVWQGIPQPACPPGGAPPVVLACITWPRYPRLDPDDPRILMIEQAHCRPLAPGVPVLRAVVESLTQCMTQVSIPPRIQQIDPPLGASLVSPATETEARVHTLVTSRSKLTATTTPPAWKLVRYPNTNDPPEDWSTSLPSGITSVALDFIEAPDGSTGPSTIDLVITKTIALPSGVYVWTIGRNDSSDEIQAQATDERMRGQDRFPFVYNPTVPAVPAGFSGADPQFTGVFYVP